MSNTYVARTLEAMRALGWIYQRVEQVVPRTHTRQDLFGCIDYLALTPLGRTVGIQVTSGSNHAARMRKAELEPRLLQPSPARQTWIGAGNWFLVWSWAKRCVRPGSARKTWKPRITRLLDQPELRGDAAIGSKLGWWIELDPSSRDLVTKAGGCQEILVTQAHLDAWEAHRLALATRAAKARALA